MLVTCFCAVVLFSSSDGCDRETVTTTWSDGKPTSTERWILLPVFRDKGVRFPLLIHRPTSQTHFSKVKTWFNFSLLPVFFCRNHRESKKMFSELMVKFSCRNEVTTFIRVNVWPKHKHSDTPLLCHAQKKTGVPGNCTGTKVSLTKTCLWVHFTLTV